PPPSQTSSLQNTEILEELEQFDQAPPPYQAIENQDNNLLDRIIQILDNVNSDNEQEEINFYDQEEDNFYNNQEEDFNNHLEADNSDNDSEEEADNQITSDNESINTIQPDEPELNIA